jgi:alanine-glyoxylate transaminase/(R)-3-amino-2-methylpropionate-pyruvate transaminase
VDAAAVDREEVIAKRERFLSPSLKTFEAYADPFVLVRGERQYVFDHEGRRYVDYLSQNLCISIGYAHPVWVDAVRQQLETLPHTTTMFHNPVPTLYAEELVGRLPSGTDWVVHLVNSGAEAVDLAFLMARLFTGNFDIVALQNSYHGLHFGAMAATGLASCRQPVPPAPGFVFAANPDQFKGAFGAGVDPYLADLDRVIGTSTSGSVAALIAEPIQGFGGVIPMPEGYLGRAFERVRAAGGLCIIDEVQTGFCRTGDSFWRYETHGIDPDIVVMSKGIGNGLPIAAVAARRDVAEAMAHRKFFNTYGANPAASAGARAVLKVLEEEHLMDNAATVGKYLRAGLEELYDRYELIGDVRGAGLMMGVELVDDRDAKTPATDQAKQVHEGLRADGVLVGRGGSGANVFRLSPPLCLDTKDVDLLLESMDRHLGRC